MPLTVVAVVVTEVAVAAVAVPRQPTTMNTRAAALARLVPLPFRVQPASVATPCARVV